MWLKISKQWQNISLLAQKRRVIQVSAVSSLQHCTMLQCDESILGQSCCFRCLYQQLGWLIQWFLSQIEGAAMNGNTAFGLSILQTSNSHVGLWVSTVVYANHHNTIDSVEQTMPSPGWLYWQSVQIVLKTMHRTFAECKVLTRELLLVHCSHLMNLDGFHRLNMLSLHEPARLVRPNRDCWQVKRAVLLPNFLECITVASVTSKPELLCTP